MLTINQLDNMPIEGRGGQTFNQLPSQVNPFQSALTQSATNLINQSVGNLLGNPAGGGQAYFDQYGNIDVTAPGGSEAVQTSDLAEATRGYIDPTLQAAENIYNVGRPDLNPLLQGYYDQSAALIDQAAGVDPRTQELAQRAVTGSQSPFFASGTPGSARAAAAAGDAAAQAILNRQAQARQELGQAGQQYQDWQTGADFDWLGRFQGALQTAPTGQVRSETLERPSGEKILTAQVNRDILEQHLGQALGQGGTSPTTYGDQSNWYSPIVNAGVNQLVGSATGAATDWIGSFFNEGGEVKQDDWF